MKASRVHLVVVLVVSGLGLGLGVGAPAVAERAAVLPPVASYRSSTVLSSSVQRGELVAADIFGNVYVTDYTKDAVVQIAPSGGTRDIRPAGVSQTRGVATDSRGNLYVVDPNGHQVAKVAPSGTQTLLTFSGLGADAGMFDAASIDAQGNLYVANCDADRIIKRWTTGRTTFISVPDGSCYGQFGVDRAGNLFLPDSSGNRVVRVDGATGARSTVALTGLLGPRGVAVDDAGVVYVVDDDGSVVARDADGQTVLARELDGAYGGIDVAPDGAVLVATDDAVVEVSVGQPPRPVATAGLNGDAAPAVGADGHVFVVDPGNRRVLDLAPDGSRSPISLPGLPEPSAIAAAPDGTLYAVDGSSRSVVARAPGGAVGPSFTVAGTGEIHAIAVDGDKTLYLLSGGGSRPPDLVKRTASGSTSTISLPPNFYAGGLAADPAGNVYVSCTDYYCVNQVLELRRSGGTRVVTQDLKQGRPAKLAVDDAGTVFVSGAGADGASIQRITASGVKATIAASYRDDRTYPTPGPIDVDGRGNLYVFDRMVGLVRMSPQSGVPSAPARPSVAMTGQSARVTWAAPAANGATITGYQVLELDGGGLVAVHPAGPSARALTVTLPVGAVRRFQVAAAVAGGAGPASAASPTVLPPFGGPSAFVDREFRTFVGRPPTATEALTSVQTLDTQTAGFVPASLRTGSDGVQTVDPVIRLYWAYFRRAPELDGLDYWVGEKRRGVALTKISDGFARSGEFVRTYGPLSDSGFVDLVYRNVLGRPADAAGSQYWVGELSARRATRGTVMVGFSESPEYVRLKRAEVDVVASFAAVLRLIPNATELAERSNELRLATSTIVDLMDDLLADPRRPT